MTDTEKPVTGYDAERDAARFATPLRNWARVGFLRGFSGMRNAIIPQGEVSLPSAVFNEIAHQHLRDGEASDDEVAKRSRYIDEVTNILTEMQGHYIELHYRRSIQGHLVDFVSALLFVGLMGGLIYQYGPYHPIPLTLIGLLASKMIFLWISVRRMVGIAQKTFNRDTHSIKLPWLATTP